MQYNDVTYGLKDGHVSLRISGRPYPAKTYISRNQHRVFMPDSRKDESYWEHRRKNNEAVRRCREKRRLINSALGNNICDLRDENRLLKKEMTALKKKLEIPLGKYFTRPDDEQSDTSATSVSQPGIVPLARPGGRGTLKLHISNNSQATIYTSPPPLLAVAAAVPMSVPVQGIPYTNGAAFPYYLMPSAEAHSRMNHDMNTYRAKSDLQRANSEPAKTCISRRKQKVYVPEYRKDESYWKNRRINNEASRRSREKRRLINSALGNNICDLRDENRLLKKEMTALKKKLEIPLGKYFTRPDDEQSDTSATSVSQPGIVPLARPGGRGTLKLHIPNNSQATIYTSPPPLLAVAAAVPMSVPVQGIPYTNGAAFPYYLMPSAEAHSRMNHDMNTYRAKSDLQRANSEPQDSSSVPVSSISSARIGGFYPQVVVKSEPTEDVQRSSNACLGRTCAPPMSPRMSERKCQHIPDNQDFESAWLDSNSNSYTSADQMDGPLQLRVNTGDKDGSLQYSLDRWETSKVRNEDHYVSSIQSTSTFPNPYMKSLTQDKETALVQDISLLVVEIPRDIASWLPQIMGEND